MVRTIVMWRIWRKVMKTGYSMLFFFFSSRRRHTRSKRDWSSDVCSSDLHHGGPDRFEAPRDDADPRQVRVADRRPDRTLPAAVPVRTEGREPHAAADQRGRTRRWRDPHADHPAAG